MSEQKINNVVEILNNLINRTQVATKWALHCFSAFVTVLALKYKKEF